MLRIYSPRHHCTHPSHAYAQHTHTPSREELRARTRESPLTPTQPKADTAPYELILHHVCPTCPEKPPGLLQPQQQSLLCFAEHRPLKPPLREQRSVQGHRRDPGDSRAPSRHPIPSSLEPYPADPQLRRLQQCDPRFPSPDLGTGQTQDARHSPIRSCAPRTSPLPVSSPTCQTPTHAFLAVTRSGLKQRRRQPAA